MPRCRLAVLGLSVIGFVCLAARPAAPDEVEEKRFAAVAEEYLDLSCRLHPAWASSLGYRAYDALLDDFSAAAIAERIALAKKYLAIFGEFDIARLSESSRIDHSLLVTDAESAIFTWSELKPHRRGSSHCLGLLCRPARSSLARRPRMQPSLSS